jgi:putative ABC transport system substrate-binding protein
MKEPANFWGGLSRFWLTLAEEKVLLARFSKPGGNCSRWGPKAANVLGLQIHVLNATTEGEINTAFAKLARLRVGALIVGTGELFNSRPEQLAALAARQGVPAIYQAREFVAVGGLMSYGASRTDAYRQAGIYVGRVLKGAKPAELPVLQSTKFELVINLTTAKALGLTVPAGVFSIVDEVIE